MENTQFQQNLNWTIEYYEKNLKKCNDLLNSFENVESIPCINFISLQNIKDQSLVRYRGMVQDMLNPEYYSSTYIVYNKQSKESYTRSGKFRDITFCENDEEFQNSDFVPKERQIFFCIPIPGTNKWVEDNLKKISFVPLQCQDYANNLKRKEMENDNTDAMETEELNATLTCSVKKNKMAQEYSETSSRNNIYNNNKYFPFGEENGVPCIIKVYDDFDEKKSSLLLNDMVEVVGFVSLNSSLEANWENSDIEDKATHPPPSSVPRIHAIFIKKLQHCNPLINQVIPKDEIIELAESTRNDLLLVLAQLLFEDTLASEFLLCHLLSKIYLRNEGHTLGKLSLNLFNINLKEFGSVLNNVLKLLVTNSHYFSLSIESLNDSSFIPKKDYESNRLWSGTLQLPDDTHLIVDETKMKEGQLNNQGCLNVIALQKLLREQEVQYDFGYYPVTYNTNIPVLVLSEGKSMFETDLRVKIKSNSATEATLKESYEAVCSYLNEELCNKIRKYFTCIRLLEFDMGEEMAKKISNDYVSLRQADEKMGSSDLHVLLVLARLLALSRGRTFLSPEDWNRAVEMETERKSRLN